MVIDTKTLLNTATALQAASLVNSNAKFALKKRKKSGEFVKTAVGTTLGATLIKIESDLIAGL